MRIEAERASHLMPENNTEKNIFPASETMETPEQTEIDPVTGIYRLKVHQDDN